MRLAFCLYHYFPYGGLQRDCLRIATACLRRGHEIHLYTESWQGEAPAGIHIHYLPVEGRQNHTRRACFIQAFQKACAENAYEAVIGFNKMPGLDIYYAADSCYQAKSRAKHGAWYRFTPRYRASIREEAAVFAPPAKTEILLIASDQQAEFSRYYQTEAQRFHILPPGIDPSRKASQDAGEVRKMTRAHLGLVDEDVFVLMVGSGFRTKGLDRALRACAALPVELRKRLHFYVVGQDHAASFARLANRLNIRERVHFLGGRDEVRSYFLSADLLIHPAYFENAGTVLLEALVAGLPVLTTDTCGYAHYIAEAGAGMVLPSPFHQAVLNKALAAMLGSPQLSEWRANALAFAESADIYSMPERAATLIETLAEAKTREGVWS